MIFFSFILFHTGDFSHEISRKIPAILAPLAKPCVPGTTLITPLRSFHRHLRGPGAFKSRTRPRIGNRKMVDVGKHRLGGKNGRTAEKTMFSNGIMG